MIFKKVYSQTFKQTNKNQQYGFWLLNAGTSGQNVRKNIMGFFFFPQGTLTMSLEEFRNPVVQKSAACVTGFPTGLLQSACSLLSEPSLRIQ